MSPRFTAMATRNGRARTVPTTTPRNHSRSNDSVTCCDHFCKHTKSKGVTLLKSIIWFGALLSLLGILGLAIPVFTSSETKDVVKLGDLKIQNTEQSTHVVPLPLS